MHKHYIIIYQPEEDDLWYAIEDIFRSKESAEAQLEVTADEQFAAKLIEVELKS